MTTCISAPVRIVRPPELGVSFGKGSCLWSARPVASNLNVCQKSGLRAGACGSGAELIQGSFLNKEG